MNKTWLIIKREYLTRVKKKSFIVMSIIGPILMAAIMILPTWLSKLDNDIVYNIAVVDNTKVFKKFRIDTSYLRDQKINSEKLDSTKVFVRRLADNKNNKFFFIDTLSRDNVIERFNELKYDVLLFIPRNLAKSKAIEIYSTKEITLATKLYITQSLENELEDQNLKTYNIDKPINVDINVLSNLIGEDGELNSSNTEITMVLGIFGGVLIYMFIFMYGAQVMRGVIEEKTSRIVEVIVSSVKPFQLMMGKIVGIAFVGLTQFLLWIILTFAIVTIVQTAILPSASDKVAEQISSQNIMDNNAQTLQTTENIDREKIDKEVSAAFGIIGNINWVVMLGMFLFYFLAGYLLYASLFAAIGSAVDSEADTQQFMLPITVPLILSFVMMQNVIQQPDGNLAFWFSMIPFTSPIIMMVRIPFGVPDWQLYLSAGILIMTFLLTTKLAAKIYRTGILMYGKKASYKEIFKWLRF
jgi:ABC-2 type transport system permease protein